MTTIQNARVLAPSKAERRILPTLTQTQALSELRESWDRTRNGNGTCHNTIVFDAATQL